MATALLVIDMQIALVDMGYRADDVLGSISGLLQRARRAGVPVVHVQHHHASYAPLMAGAAGWAIHPRLSPESGELGIGKTESDAFHRTPLETELRRLG